MSEKKERKPRSRTARLTDIRNGAGHFCGRDKAVSDLLRFLSEPQDLSSKVVVQSIEGPGGIGKTALFEHVLAKVDRVALKQLTMKVSGNPEGQRDPFELVHALVTSCESPTAVAKPIAQRFSNTEEVRSVYCELTKKATTELQHAHPELSVDMCMRLFRASVELGKRINDFSPNSKKLLDLKKVEAVLPKVEETLKTLKPLLDEAPGMLEKLGVGKSVALRNSIRANPLDALADAFVSDLVALLVGYEKKKLLEPTQAKVLGLNRLLLILDDYESLTVQFGEFLVSHLVPKLKRCPFETVIVIMGRDQLALTHSGWNQHHQRSLANPIALAPLSREEMDSLVKGYGRNNSAQLSRAWNDTLGYPLLVTLWLEEAREAGHGEGPSIGMLKRFHDRTTHWLTEEQKQWLYHSLFLPKVNVETFAATLGSEDEGRRAMKWFEADGSVRDAQGPVFRVRPYVCSRLVDYLDATDPALSRNLKSRAATAIN